MKSNAYLTHLVLLRLLDKKKNFRFDVNLLTVVLLFTAAPPLVRGQELTAQQRASLCESKQSTLRRLEAEADVSRNRLAEDISHAERRLAQIRAYRERVMNAPRSEAISDLNSTLQTVRYDISRNKDGLRSPNARIRAQAESQLAELYPFHDYLTRLLASLESGGILPEGDPDDDPFVKDAERKVRTLKNRYDQIGSDINTLRQSIESLGCSGGKADLTKRDLEALRTRERSDSNANVEDAEARAGEGGSNDEKEPAETDLPPALKGKKIIRTEKVESVECWQADSNVPCTEPNLEVSMTIYHLGGGGAYWDRREYDRKRAEKANAGLKFAWSCAKASWRNGRCG